MIRIRPIAVAAALAAVFACGKSRAAGPACQVANVTPMSFGMYQAGQTGPVDSAGELDVSCSVQAAVQISLGRSLSGHQAPREMLSRGSPLAYDLFLDATHTMTWGDGTQGTQLYMGTALAAQTLRLLIYGRIFGLQSVPPGTYTDRIVVVVTF